MRPDIRTLQGRVAALGFSPGPIDGKDGRQTRAAVAAAMERHGVSSNAKLFHPTGIHRIHMHWTGGGDGVNAVERRSYNGLVDRDGERHLGKWSFEDQAHYKAGVRGASHTLNFNSYAIGLTMDAMANAKERPFYAGTAPMAWEQVDAFAKWCAELSVKYWIPVTRFSTLTHAEIQPTFGITQRWKWDINWLPDMSEPGDPIEVGDRLRGIIREHVEDIERPKIPAPQEQQASNAARDLARIVEIVQPYFEGA